MSVRLYLPGDASALSVGAEQTAQILFAGFRGGVPDVLPYRRPVIESVVLLSEVAEQGQIQGGAQVVGVGDEQVAVAALQQQGGREGRDAGGADVVDAALARVSSIR